MHAVAISGKRGYYFEGEQGRYMGAFWGKKGREKYNYNFNNKNTHKNCKLFYNINNPIWYKKRIETLSFKFHNFRARCAAVAG